MTASTTIGIIITGLFILLGLLGMKGKRHRWMSKDERSTQRAIVIGGAIVFGASVWGSLELLAWFVRSTIQE